jgi:hypothetical protein
MKFSFAHFLMFAVFLILLVPSAGLAYVGPGAGLTAIGAVFALVGSVLLAVIGFIWYPIRRLRRALKERSKPRPDASVEVSGEITSGS